ncbi:hypothetical protein FI667_g8589, partial [Globisporangium splendens]
MSRHATRSEDERLTRPPARRQDRADTTIASARIYEPQEPVPWNPARNRILTHIKLGTMTLDAWLQSYEQEFLAFESLEKFIAVKLPEPLAFCDKLEQQTKQSSESSTTSKASVSSSSHFHVRLRIAVFAHLVERTIFAMVQSAALSHAKKALFQAR